MAYYESIINPETLGFEVAERDYDNKFNLWQQIVEYSNPTKSEYSLIWQVVGVYDSLEDANIALSAKREEKLHIE